MRGGILHHSRATTPMMLHKCQTDGEICVCSDPPPSSLAKRTCLKFDELDWCVWDIPSRSYRYRQSVRAEWCELNGWEQQPAGCRLEDHEQYSDEDGTYSGILSV